MNTLVRGMRRVFFGVMAAVFLGLFLVGCIENPAGDGAAGGSGEDSSLLVLPSGWAWVSASGRDACVFTSCNRVVLIERDPKGWNWIVYKEGEYIIAENQIALDFGSGDYMNGIYTFELSGDGNRITTGNNTGAREVYTKTSGVYFSNTPTDPGPGPGGNLILGSGEAWVNGAHGTDIGIIFQANGSVMLLVMNQSGTWDIYSEGTYTTRGSTTSVNTPRVSFTGTYSVSDDTYTILLNEETLVFTKRSGINISAR